MCLFFLLFPVSWFCRNCFQSSLVDSIFTIACSWTLNVISYSLNSYHYIQIWPPHHTDVREESLAFRWIPQLRWWRERPFFKNHAWPVSHYLCICTLLSHSICFRSLIIRTFWVQVLDKHWQRYSLWKSAKGWFLLRASHSFPQPTLYIFRK